MKFTTLSLFTLHLAAITNAAPAPQTSFLLVATSQSEPTSNSSTLPQVAATSLWDADHSGALGLRLQPSGYNSLPTFNLTDSVMSTAESQGTSDILYNSTTVEAGRPLQFLAQPQSNGNLGLEGGYLLTVNGEKEGWTICSSEATQRTEVLYWKGTDTGCKPTFIQAVSSAPYRKK